MYIHGDNWQCASVTVSVHTIARVARVQTIQNIKPARPPFCIKNAPLPDHKEKMADDVTSLTSCERSGVISI